MNIFWEVLSSDNAFEHRWYVVRRDIVRLPDGRVEEYFLSDRPEVAIIVPVDVEGRVVMVRQYKHGAKRSVLEFPAGTFRGETPEAAAQRELLEETGHQPGQLISLGRCFDDTSKNTNTVHMFLARGCRQIHAPTPDANELAGGIEVVRLSVDAMLTELNADEATGASTLAAAFRAYRHFRP